MSLLEMSNLDAGYNDLQILSDIDIYVDEGEYIVVVGPNGAGKSTAMKSVFSLANVMAGTIKFRGESIVGDPPETHIERGIAYSPQSENVFPSLTVRENLRIGAYTSTDINESDYSMIYDRFPILRDKSEQRAGSLSGGQQQMLALGRALITNPDLLLLDEPSAGLAPDLVEDVFDKIDEINRNGTSMLMVEQNAKDALKRCDRGYVLAQGENRFEGTGEELLDDEDVRRQFLGG